MLIATDGVLRYLWIAVGLAALICLLLVLTHTVSRSWLAAVGLVVAVLAVPTIARFVIVYRRRPGG